MLFAAKQYIQYRRKAVDAHGLHSPFMFRLYQDVFQEDTPFYSFKYLEESREHLLDSRKEIPIVDYGAGSKKGNKKVRAVRELASSALTPAKRAQLLFRMVNYFGSGHIVELGTSLGLTTAYLAKVNSTAQVVSFEGNPGLVEQATDLFEKLSIQNVQLVEGPFEKTLPEFVDSVQDPIDFLYLDGNHQYQPTLNYFEWLLPKMAKNGVVVLDDINWSPDMRKAWEKIVSNDRLAVTAETFYQGFVFLGVKCPKQHFVLK